MSMFEYSDMLQVLEALGIHTQVPVPKVFCLCTDPSIIGTAFYIMEYLEGRIYLDPKLPVRFHWIVGYSTVPQLFLISLLEVMLLIAGLYSSSSNLSCCQGVTPERRNAIYHATAKALASLHSVNVDSIGLGKFGRRDDYCKRQVSYLLLMVVAFFDFLTSYTNEWKYYLI